MLDILEFNGIKKLYNDKILCVNNLVLSEQWFRFQILKICELLSIKISDELGIVYSNKTLCEKIKEKYNNIDDITFTKQEQNQLQQYGLQKNDMIIPIPKKQLTEQQLIDIDNQIITKGENTVIEWKKWEKQKFSNQIEIETETETDYEEIDYSILTKDIFNEDEDDSSQEDTDYQENDYQENTITNIITQEFVNSDQMKKVGDCLFDSIRTIITEKTGQTNLETIELRQKIVDHYVLQSSLQQLKLFIGSITDENYQLTTTQKITEADLENRDNVNQILTNMILSSNYWGDSMEVQYFYHYLQKEYNITLLVMDETTYKLKFNSHTFDDNSTFSLIAYTGNHYYNKQLVSTNNYIFTKQQINFKELQELVILDKEYLRGRRIYQTPRDFKITLFQNIQSKTQFQIETIQSLLSVYQQIVISKNIISNNEMEFYNYLYNTDTFSRWLLKTSKYLQTHGKTVQDFLQKANIENQNLVNYIVTQKESDLDAFLSEI